MAQRQADHGAEAHAPGGPGQVPQGRADRLQETLLLEEVGAAVAAQAQLGEEQYARPGLVGGPDGF
jgi:hypothetical protein